MFPLRWNFPFRKKDGSMVNLEDAMGGGGGGGLPSYTSADAGKVLGVTDQGTLAWVTVSSGGNRFSATQSSVTVDVNTISEGGT